MRDFKKVRFIIWDMDQTLYPYWEDLGNHCYEATAHCALEAGVPLTKAEADELARLSYRERGVTTRLFQEQFGVDEAALFRAHHRRMLDNFMDPNWAAKVPENPELAHLMMQARTEGAIHLLLTNGSREWAEELAKKIGIHQYFQIIMGADDVGLRQKGQNLVPYLAVLGRAHYFGDYKDVMVVEDSLKNLVQPKEINMHTAWVQWNNPKAEKQAPAYIDDVFHTPNDVLKAWFADRNVKIWPMPEAKSGLSASFAGQNSVPIQAINAQSGGSIPSNAMPRVSASKPPKP